MQTETNRQRFKRASEISFQEFKDLQDTNLKIIDLLAKEGLTFGHLPSYLRYLGAFATNFDSINLSDLVALKVGQKPPTSPAPKHWGLFLSYCLHPTQHQELQEFFGYCLSDETRFEKALVLFGPNSRAIDICLRVLTSLVGPGETSRLDLTLLDDEGIRAELIGLKLNIHKQADPEVFQDGYFKSIVSGDLILAARDDEIIEFRPTVKFVVTTPVFQNLDEHSKRRLLPLEFFRADSMFAGQVKLHDLFKELDAIRQWTEQGLESLRRRGYFQHSAHTESILRGGRYFPPHNQVAAN